MNKLHADISPVSGHDGFDQVGATSETGPGRIAGPATLRARPHAALLSSPDDAVSSPLAAPTFTTSTTHTTTATMGRR